MTSVVQGVFLLIYFDCGRKVTNLISYTRSSYIFHVFHNAINPLDQWVFCLEICYNTDMSFLTFQDQYTRIQDATGDDSSDTLTILKEQINDYTSDILYNFSRFIFEKTKDLTSVADQQGYNLPIDLIRVTEVTYENSDRTYYLEEVADRKQWRVLNEIDTSSSTPSHFYVDKEKVYLYPAAASAGDTIKVYYEPKIKDMTEDDYTTGNITTISGTTVTGSSTVWTSAMAGRWIKLDSDGYWYQIASVTSSTELELEQDWEGSAVSGASESYVIGEQSLGKYEDLHMLPVYGALMFYFSTVREDNSEYIKYENMYNRLFERAKTNYGNRTSDDVIATGRMPERYEPEVVRLRR